MSNVIRTKSVRISNLELAPTLYVCSQGRFSAKEVGEVDVPADMPGVKGIFVGGCKRRGAGRISDSIQCEYAHAHIGGTLKGWICFQLPCYFWDAEYHWLRMHELAHIISGQGHTEKWREALRKLGEEIPDRYRYRPRRKK